MYKKDPSGRSTITNYLSIHYNDDVYQEDDIIPLDLTQAEDHHYFYLESNCRTMCHSSDGLFLEMTPELLAPTNLYENAHRRQEQPQTSNTAIFSFHTNISFGTSISP